MSCVPLNLSRSLGVPCVFLCVARTATKSTVSQRPIPYEFARLCNKLILVSVCACARSCQKTRFKNENVPQTLKQTKQHHRQLVVLLHYTSNCWLLHKCRDISCVTAASRPRSIQQQLDKEYYLSHLHNTSHSRSNALKWCSKCHHVGTQFGSHSYTGICSLGEHMSA